MRFMPGISFLLSDKSDVYYVSSNRGSFDFVWREAPEFAQDDTVMFPARCETQN
jgi:hypothetical protein